jgi:hypothetical protein
MVAGDDSLKLLDKRLRKLAGDVAHELLVPFRLENEGCYQGRFRASARNFIRGEAATQLSKNFSRK